MAVKQEQERQMVFTTKLVDESTDKINDGIVLKRYQNLGGKLVNLRNNWKTF